MRPVVLPFERVRRDLVDAPDHTTLRAPARTRGTTLVELMIVIAVVAIATGIFSRMVIATSKLRQVNRDNGIAAEAARIVFEEMHNVPFQQVFALYNADPNDDPGGVGTAPGHLRWVDGLDLADSDTTGFQMEVILPSYHSDVGSTLSGTKWEYETTTTTSSGGKLATGGSLTTEPEPEPDKWELREDYVDEDLGMPRDLNGDSIVDAEDHAHDYILLPVMVRVTWQGQSGERVFEAHTMIADLKAR